MRKIGMTLLSVILLLSGCADTGKSVSKSSVVISSESQVAVGYTFETNGISIAMHALVAPILEKLGEPKEYFEAPSCAFQGIEKTYVYPSFSLYTYELESVDYVASVVILDDSISTTEGISLNDPLNKVTTIYGSNFIKSIGLYSYESGKMKLSFLIEDDVVTSIEYVALADK